MGMLREFLEIWLDTLTFKPVEKISYKHTNHAVRHRY
jgi:hypothetical protein